MGKESGGGGEGESPREGELPRTLRGRPHDRRPLLDRDSPGRTNGNAVSNPRIRASSPTSSGFVPTPARSIQKHPTASPLRRGVDKPRSQCLTWDIRVL